MKITTAFITLIMMFLFTISVQAEDSVADTNTDDTYGTMQVDTDGHVDANEYRIVSMNGGITRRPCPYTCEMRGIPQEHCKEWKAVLKLSAGEECYVQDTRLPSDAIPMKE